MSDATQEAKHALSGRMGVRALTLTVLAFSAPMAVVSGFIPFSIYFGGQGAAFSFVAVTVILMFFALGYVTMTRHVPKPGAFYVFISSGLGKVAGLGAAFLAVSAYLVMLAGVYAQFGVTVARLIESLHGPATPWLVWAIAAWVIVGILGHFHIELSARILSVVLVLEVALVMIYNVAVLVRGGSGGTEALSLLPLSPVEFLKGDIGVTLLFGVLVFLGFESTALFRDEVRRPNITIPRATFGAVLFVGALYTLSCFTLTSAYGTGAVQAATDNPATMFPTSIGQYVGPAFTQITYLFVASSVFAALLAIHNVLARYLFNLGSDRALPSYFAAVHRSHGSPYRSSALSAGIVAALVLAFVVTGNDGATLYAQLTGLSAVGVLTLMALVSLAIIAWFARTGVPQGENWFKAFLAPGIACVALAATVVLALTHFELVVGGAPGENVWLISLPLAGLVIGVVLALYFKLARSHVFDGLGREGRVVVDLAPAPAAAPAE